jgi:hypothetical protein
MASQEQANSKTSETASGCLILIILAAVLIGLIWLFAPDTFYKYAYVFEYNVSAENVIMDSKPKNCDWEHAPLGDKGCHYKKAVTPQKDDKNRVTSVYVSWERVED